MAAPALPTFSSSEVNSRPIAGEAPKHSKKSEEIAVVIGNSAVALAPLITDTGISSLRVDRHVFKRRALIMPIMKIRRGH